MMIQPSSRLTPRPEWDRRCAIVDLLDNETGIPVRLVTDAGGGGGVEMLEYDLENRKALVTRLTSKGKTVRELDLGGAKKWDGPDARPPINQTLWQ
jgi:hypothetical protein